MPGLRSPPVPMLGEGTLPALPEPQGWQCLGTGLKSWDRARAEQGICTRTASEHDTAGPSPPPPACSGGALHGAGAALGSARTSLIRAVGTAVTRDEPRIGSPLPTGTAGTQPFCSPLAPLPQGDGLVCWDLPPLASPAAPSLGV